MQRQNDIEIYVLDCSMPQLLTWINAAAGPLGQAQDSGDATIYPSRIGPVVITPSTQQPPLVGVWFNTPDSPWPTDVDCARDATRSLGCIVRCDPGQHFPSVPAQAPVMLELSGTTERLVSA